MNTYASNSIMFGSMGLPVGLMLGYALAKWDTYSKNHPHRRMK